MKIQKFEELNIWKLSINLTKEIYDLTLKKEFSRDFGLRDQIRRAIVSVSSNIIEVLKGIITRFRISSQPNRPIYQLS